MQMDFGSFLIAEIAEKVLLILLWYSDSMFWNYVRRNEQFSYRNRN